MRHLMAILTLVALAIATPASATADDAAIAKELVKKLRQHQKSGDLKGFRVGLKVKNGDVWLEGAVSSREQQHLVLELARHIEGVNQVVNAMEIAGDKPEAKPRQEVRPQQMNQPRSILAGVNQGDRTLARRTPLPALEIPTGTSVAAPQPGVREPARIAAGQAPTRPIASLKQNAVARDAQMQEQIRALQEQIAQQQAVIAQYTQRQPQMPVAYAPSAQARQVSLQQAQAMEGMQAPPQPAYMPGTSGGIAPATYDHPRLPGYAWPSYAAYPNYAGLTYPRQYSATAWPYIGPFYPYPQVPLGWRKVMLEWDDGWWMLDFKAKGVAY